MAHRVCSLMLRSKGHQASMFPVVSIDRRMFVIFPSLYLPGSLPDHVTCSPGTWHTLRHVIFISLLEYHCSLRLSLIRPSAEFHVKVLLIFFSWKQLKIEMVKNHLWYRKRTRRIKVSTTFHEQWTTISPLIVYHRCRCIHLGENRQSECYGTVQRDQILCLGNSIRFSTERL